MTRLQELTHTASAMVAPGKGILAVDESVKTCTKRFQAAGIESTPDSRRDYREMMFRAPSLGQYISGAILYDETIRQSSPDGTPLPKLLQDAGVIPGIKVDTGAYPLPKAPGETVTEGLDGLADRLVEYREMGARFTKWRAVLRIDGEEKPSDHSVHTNAHAMARYAAHAQEAGLVPIVEPEVLMDGDHTIDRCQAATEAVLIRVFAELVAQRVALDGIVLKPNMVVAGADCPEQPDSEHVAEMTLSTLRHSVPEAVPGVAFLSGGMTGEEACRNLDAMNRRGPHPWQLSFSFGRALQYPGLEIWAGKPENIPAAQQALLHRCRMSSLARQGQYSPEAERG